MGQVRAAAALLNAVSRPASHNLRPHPQLQVLFALAYCHQMGMACRDIKLENVLVTEYVAGAPVVKLCDFGLSLAVCDKGSATAHSHSLVSPPPLWMLHQLRRPRSSARSACAMSQPCNCCGCSCPPAFCSGLC